MMDLDKKLELDELLCSLSSEIEKGLSFCTKIDVFYAFSNSEKIIIRIKSLMEYVGEEHKNKTLKERVARLEMGLDFCLKELDKRDK